MRTLVILFLLAGAASAQAAPWTLSGWVEGSYNASSARRTNLPMGFFFEAGAAQLNQAWLTLDQPAGKDAGHRSAGVHLDIFAGTDSAFTRAFGLFSHQSGEIGFDPVQFYISGHVEGFAKGTDLKLGRFASPIGAEYNAGAANALASHSYTFIYDPFTHTGLYSETALSDRWTLLAGLVTGSDVFVDPGVEPTGIGGARYVGADPKKSVQLTAIIGPGRFNAQRGFNDVDVVDIVGTYPLRKRLLLTLEGTVGWEDAVPGQGDVSWQGALAYLTWTVSAQLDANLRLELFSDDQGNRTGFQGDYRAVTAGLKWQPGPRWMLRPELRHDDHSGAAPFEGKQHLTTATLDVVRRF